MRAIPFGNARSTLLAAAVALASPLRAQEPPARLMSFLQQQIGLDEGQMAAMEKGEAVAKVLDSPNKRDVTLFGIVQIDVTREAYVTRLQDFTNSLPSPTRVRVGIFHDPAIQTDVATAVVSPQDVADVKACKPGDCKIKMPATDMQQLHTSVDWSGQDGDVAPQLTTYVQRRMLEYVTDYRARGDSAMLVYDDHGGVHGSDAFADLIAQSPYVYQDFPSLRQYLTSYPHATLGGAREVFYWAVDSSSGMRRIVSVNHLVLYAPAEQGGMTVVAVKQIYANHYFEAGFELTAIIDRGGAEGKPGIYLAAFRKWRFDNLPGGVMNIRGKVIGKLRDQIKHDLEVQKALSEGRPASGH
jgi:hypothetical protein